MNPEDYGWDEKVGDTEIKTGCWQSITQKSPLNTLWLKCQKKERKDGLQR